MLDDDDGVPDVAQPAQDAHEPRVVPRMEADGRLVEHVERADQVTAERGRQVDALRLAARERAGLAIERQVAEPRGVEHLEPCPDLLEDRAFGRQPSARGSDVVARPDALEERASRRRPPSR